MYRNERYFDKNDREQNYFGQLEEHDLNDFMVETKSPQTKKADNSETPDNGDSEP